MKNGWLFVYKPSGPVSMRITKKIKSTLGVKKAGHAGTLDPFADGLLPIAIGESCKTMPYMMRFYKTYIFTLFFGYDTDTKDCTGSPVNYSKNITIPSENDINETIKGFIGRIRQKPPVFSAVKVNGRPSYELARKNKRIDLPEKEVHVKNLFVRSYQKKQKACVFEICCSSGTYVRSIGEDIAHALDRCGHLTSLTRTSIGPFGSDCSVYPDSSKTHLEQSMMKIEDLNMLPIVFIEESEKEKFTNGQHVATRSFSFAEKDVFVKCGDRLLGIARTQENLLYPSRLFKM